MTVWAIFGGSFDPPHVGHVLAASWALSTQAIDALIVVPVFEHAFGKPLTAFEHRLRMAELAFAPLRGVEVSDVERRMGGASYTVHTLERLRAEHPDVQLRLIVGSDLVEQVPRWREGHRVPQLAPLLVVGRAGHDDDDASEVAMPRVSSTEIRRRLAAGEPVDAMVPRAVVDHIARHALYR